MKPIKMKENSNILIVRVYDDDENYTASSFAVVEIDEELKKKILQMNRLVKLSKNSIDDSIYTMTAWDYNCQYISESEFDATSEQEVLDALEEVRDEIEEGAIGVEEFDVDEDKGVELLRVDGEQLIVTERGFKFDCLIKHTGQRLYTPEITIDYLNKIIIPKTVMETE